MEYMVPKKIEEHYSDMNLPNSSRWARANAARRYAEAITDLFLTENLKNMVSGKYYKMKFAEILSAIENEITSELKDALNFIREVGNNGSHISRPDKQLKEENVEKAVSIATQDLMPLVLHNYFVNVQFFSIEYGPKLFSTLMPAIRERVLEKLIDFRSKKLLMESDEDKNILHKYVMACHKNGNREKIRRRLRMLHSKRRITESMYTTLTKTISNLDENSTSLPIPRSVGDCKRNFEAVLDEMPQNAIENNRILINIISNILNGYESTQIGELKKNYIMNNEHIDFKKL